MATVQYNDCSSSSRMLSRRLLISIIYRTWRREAGKLSQYFVVISCVAEAHKLMLLGPFIGGVNRISARVARGPSSCSMATTFSL